LKHALLVWLGRQCEACRGETAPTRHVLRFDSRDELLDVAEFGSFPHGVQNRPSDALAPQIRGDNDCAPATTVVVPLDIDEADWLLLSKGDPGVTTDHDSTSILSSWRFIHESKLAPDPLAAPEEPDGLAVVEPRLDHRQEVWREASESEAAHRPLRVHESVVLRESKPSGLAP
jgi:hypothetical protein